MAKHVVVDLGGEVSSFDFSAVRREQLYGRRRRLALDASGEPCTRASILADGSLLLRSGMTGQGYFTPDLTWVSNREVEGVAVDGGPAPLVPSTLDVAQPLEGPIDAAEVLDLDVLAIYALTPAEVGAGLRDRMAAGEMFRFAFNYRDDFRAETAVLLANDNGTFALVGYPSQQVWDDLDDEPEVAAPADDAADVDDLDFDMF